MICIDMYVRVLKCPCRYTTNYDKWAFYHKNAPWPNNKSTRNL